MDLYKKSGKVIARCHKKCYHGYMRKEREKKFCPECSEVREVIKYGPRYVDQNKDQRYKCCFPGCNREFYESAKNYSAETKYVAQRLYNAIPCRVIAKLLKINSFNSVCNWGKADFVKINPFKLYEYVEGLKAPYEIAAELQNTRIKLSILKRDLNDAVQLKRDRAKNREEANVPIKTKFELEEELHELETERDKLLTSLADDLKTDAWKTDAYRKNENRVWILDGRIKAKKAEISEIDNPWKPTLCKINIEPNIDDMKEKLNLLLHKEAELEVKCEIKEEVFLENSPTIYAELTKISEEMKRRMQT